MIKTHRLLGTEVESHRGLKLPAEGDDVGLWIEVVEPDEKEQAVLRRDLGLHEISLRAVMRPGHPPKFAEYDSGLMLMVHTPISDDAGRPRKVAMFLAPNLVVTILRKPLATLQFSMKRMRETNVRDLSDPALVLYAILDEMTAGFEGLGDSMFDRLDRVEESMESGSGKAIMSTILAYRRDLQGLVRVIRRQRDVVQSFARSKHPVIDNDVLPYFRDSADYLARVYDLLESARDGIMAVRDGYLSIVNNRLSETMRVLTVIATIMMPLSLVAGIYGMNVGWLPASGLPSEGGQLGFWVVMGLMACMAAAMLAWFRKRKWI